jgi:hypothetical protein
VEACCSGKHARQVTALHYGQLAVHIGEADGTLVPRLGESGVAGFAEELHGPGTEPLQGIRRDRAECISWAVEVGKVVPALVSIPKISAVTLIGQESRIKFVTQQGSKSTGDSWSPGLPRATSCLFTRALGQVAYWVSGGFPFTDLLHQWGREQKQPETGESRTAQQ